MPYVIAGVAGPGAACLTSDEFYVSGTPSESLVKGLTLASEHFSKTQGMYYFAYDRIKAAVILKSVIGESKISAGTAAQMLYRMADTVRKQGLPQRYGFDDIDIDATLNAALDAYNTARREMVSVLTLVNYLPRRESYTIACICMGLDKLRQGGNDTDIRVMLRVVPVTEAHRAVSAGAVILGIDACRVPDSNYIAAEARQKDCVPVCESSKGDNYYLCVSGNAVVCRNVSNLPKLSNQARIIENIEYIQELRVETDFARTARLAKESEEREAAFKAEADQQEVKRLEAAGSSGDSFWAVCERCSAELNLPPSSIPVLTEAAKAYGIEIFVSPSGWIGKMVKLIQYDRYIDKIELSEVRNLKYTGSIGEITVHNSYGFHAETEVEINEIEHPSFIDKIICDDSVREVGSPYTDAIQGGYVEELSCFGGNLTGMPRLKKLNGCYTEGLNANDSVAIPESVEEINSSFTGYTKNIQVEGLENVKSILYSFNKFKGGAKLNGGVVKLLKAERISKSFNVAGLSDATIDSRDCCVDTSFGADDTVIISGTPLLTGRNDAVQRPACRYNLNVSSVNGIGFLTDMSGTINLSASCDITDKTLKLEPKIIHSGLTCTIGAENPSEIINTLDLEQIQYPVSVNCGVNEIKGYSLYSYSGKTIVEIKQPEKLKTLSCPLPLAESQMSNSSLFAYDLRGFYNLSAINDSTFRDRHVQNQGDMRTCVMLLPDSLEEIGDRAFERAKLNVLVLGKTTRIFGRSVFSGMGKNSVPATIYAYEDSPAVQYLKKSPVNYKLIKSLGDVPELKIKSLEETETAQAAANILELTASSIKLKISADKYLTAQAYLNPNSSLKYTQWDTVPIEAPNAGLNAMPLPGIIYLDDDLKQIMNKLLEENIPINGDAPAAMRAVYKLFVRGLIKESNYNAELYSRIIENLFGGAVSNDGIKRIKDMLPECKSGSSYVAAFGYGDYVFVGGKGTDTGAIIGRDGRVLCTELRDVRWYDNAKARIDIPEFIDDSWVGNLDFANKTVCGEAWPDGIVSRIKTALLEGLVQVKAHETGKRSGGQGTFVREFLDIPRERLLVFKEGFTSRNANELQVINLDRCRLIEIKPVSEFRS